MSKEVVVVRKLTKTFELYDSTKDRLKELAHPLRKKYHRKFAALKDISFSIKRGEVIGILGKNGAGKSTLLKILTGVLAPTDGQVTVQGKVAALLELGAGFNPELSGLENVYFQGAIMGFRRADMKSLVPKIVDFADIGEFINQPVKTYSSGMFARLAFSIAINVSPDILIVDEALSVGDIRFQQKCLRRMKEFNDQGKTVIYVSHDVSQIKSLCSKAIWLKDSVIEMYDEASLVCDQYLSWMTYGEISDLKRKEKEAALDKHGIWNDVVNVDSFGRGGAQIKAYKIANLSNSNSVHFSNGDKISLDLEIHVKKDLPSPGVGILFKNRAGLEIFTINNYIYNKSLESWREGDVYNVKFEFTFPSILNGDYTVVAAVANGTQEEHTSELWIHDLLHVRSFNEGEIYKLGSFLIVDKDVQIVASRK